MKIKKSILHKIIKEELEKELDEVSGKLGGAWTALIMKLVSLGVISGVGIKAGMELKQQEENAGVFLLDKQKDKEDRDLKQLERLSPKLASQARRMTEQDVNRLVVEYDINQSLVAVDDTLKTQARDFASGKKRKIGDTLQSEKDRLKRIEDSSRETAKDNFIRRGLSGFSMLPALKRGALIAAMVNDPTSWSVKKGKIIYIPKTTPFHN